MRIRTTGILGLFLALAVGVPTVVSCAATSSGPGGSGGAAGNYGSPGCTKTPQQDCTKCSSLCAQCVCFNANTSQCAPLCKGTGTGGSAGFGGSGGTGGSVSSGGTGGSVSSGGTGGGGQPCTPGNCSQCTSCFDSCVCAGGNAQQCLSACGGNGGSGGSGFGGSGGGFGGTGGGFGGTGGTGGGTANLGAQCTTNSQCGTAGICATTTGTTFGGGGPSRGYCTAPCTQNSDCTSLSANAQCVSFASGGTYCLLGCNASASDPCLDRYDEMCLDLVSGDASTGVQACIPECVTDADCSGLKCDLSTGLCTSTPTTGDPIGTDCDPISSTNTCAGFCIGTSSTDSTQGMCSALCNNGTNSSSVGVIGACGSNATTGSAQDAACLFQATMSSGTSVGICSQLCNCNADCRTTGFICESWADAGLANPSSYVTAFGKQGLCVGLDPDAGISGIACGTDAGL